MRALFSIFSGYEMAESPLKKNGAEEKMQARIGGVWIAKLPDNGMAQCNLCAMDFSISSCGRTDVRRLSWRVVSALRGMGWSSSI